MKYIATKLTLFLSVSFFLLTSINISFAQEKSAQEPDDVAIIQGLRLSGAQVEYMGEYDGLDGWYIKANGNKIPYAAYTTQNGHMVIGQYYDDLGHSKADDQIAKVIERFDIKPENITTKNEHVAPITSTSHTSPNNILSPEKKLMAITDQAFGFINGHQGPVFTVFADPTCPFCEKQLEYMNKLADQGLMRVRVIPVGILGQEALNKTIWVLGQENPVKAWEIAKLGAVNKAELTDAAREKINFNLDLFSKGWRTRSVPLTVYRNSEGEIRIYHGMIAAPRSGARDQALMMINDALGKAQP